MSYLRQLTYLTVAKGAILSSFVTLCDRNNFVTAKDPSNNGTRPSESSLRSQYSHIVIGYGSAGSAATRELLRHAKSTDSVLVVDPIANLKKSLFPLKEDKRLTFEQNSAYNIDHVHKIIQLADGSLIRFENCLISVGSVAAPINPQYVDSDCDLQRTVIDLNHPNAPHDLYSLLMNDSDAQGQAVRPQSIALVGGNSWESVELAGRLAMAAEHKHHERYQQQPRQRSKPSLPLTSTSTLPKAKANSNEVDQSALPATPPVPPKDTVSLVYPAYGPMSHTLPRYLSLALAKRLHGLGVHLVPYSYVRYLGTTPTGTVTEASQAVLFLAKTYDSLNTQSLTVDRVTFAPTAIPTPADRELLKRQSSQANDPINPNPNKHHAHGFLLRSGLELDRITGGVVANQSLQVCEGVFVAGDVASVYSGSGRCVDLRDTNKISTTVGTSSSGVQQRGVVRGYHNAVYSGTVAGRNMALSNRTANSSSTNTNISTHTTTNNDNNNITPLLYSHLPVYEVHSVDIGVHFTFIGNCSSALESHGYWWKLAGASKVNVSTHMDADRGAEEVIRPPLGLGVVFYVDNNTIAGVLISGLPVATRPLHGTSIGNNNGATTSTDHIYTLCKTLIGRSVHTLDLGYNSSGSSKGSRRVDVNQAYEVTAEDMSEPEPTADETAPLVPDSTLSAVSVDGDGISAVEVFVSQALSWEARRLLSPVLSAALYQHNNASAAQLDKHLNAYPRPLYRYCGPSRTTTKDLTEPHTLSIIRPAVCREALFQPEFANTGSRADNVKTAYKRSMAKDLY